MNLPLFIAGRYLFSRKSHGVINIISAISAIGMALGTAAFIVILSVYNGFDKLVKESLSNVEPDIQVTPSEGKVFVAEGEAWDYAYTEPMILNMSSVLQDNVYAKYGDAGTVATAKGVDSVYEEESPIVDCIQEGKFTLHKGDLPQVAVGSGLAYKMGISPSFLTGMDIYYPDRDSQISMSNPASSLNTVKVFPSGVFAVNTAVDESLMILPLETMRRLMGYTDEVSAIEIRLKPEATGRDLRRIIGNLQQKLGPSFRVKDRFAQNETLYKMMRYEKAAVFLILGFVVIIIAFNIYGSLSMLIIEKKEDIQTLRSLGAEDGLIRRIFILEGWLISLLGLAVGLVLGIGFVILQSSTGMIKMPAGAFTTPAYPVILQAGDVLIAALSVALIGYVIALLPVRRWAKEEAR